MDKKKILATPRSFGKVSQEPVNMLEKAGYAVVLNPYGRIMNVEEMKKQIADVAGVIIGIDPLQAPVLACAGNLKAISKYGIGTDNIDLEMAKAMGIPVRMTAGANTDAVADYTFALMLACARKVVAINASCHQKDWIKMITTDIYGKTLGILGLGAIGKAVAHRASGFDMKVLAYDVNWNQDYAANHGISYAMPEALYAGSDFISVHLPLTSMTNKMISDDAFNLMKPSAILVNTARGGIIDEQALVRALQTGKIYAAGIDAFSEEPPLNEALYTLDNLIMGAHCASATTGAIEAMGILAAKNLLDMLC